MFLRARLGRESRALVPSAGVDGGSGPSILAADLHLRGDLASQGELHVDGHVEGDVHAHTLVVGATGTILGSIAAEEAVVHGHVRGYLRARKVHLLASRKVVADIEHDVLCIDEGATFEGQCRRVELQALEPEDASWGDGAGHRGDS